MADMARGIGRTREQMLAAPPGAIFIWGGHELRYAVRLAADIGRGDLRIRPLSWFDDGAWRGLDMTGLVIDHAVAMSCERFASLREIRSVAERPAVAAIGE